MTVPKQYIEVDGHIITEDSNGDPIDSSKDYMIWRIFGEERPRATQTIPSYLRTFNAEQTKQLREDGIGASAPNPAIR